MITAENNLATERKIQLVNKYDIYMKLKIDDNIRKCNHGKMDLEREKNTSKTMKIIDSCKAIRGDLKL